MFNLIFLENYAKLNMSATYVNVKTGHGDIDENIMLNGPNEEGFLKNIEVTTSVFVCICTCLNLTKLKWIMLLASGL